MDRRNLYIGILLLTATVLLMANYFAATGNGPDDNQGP